ncbi:hypothetical protein MHIMP23_18565 [Methylobacterium hispanicum]|nr:hypothetical protein [Xanthomonas perforans]NEL27327.1 hypothetical protein [Xanthomonas perforans]NEL74207.1 hypothetical protein [Xanthomonas perforans]NEM46354.1 hypothetical protein [Xanthomonas perforans]
MTEDLAPSRRSTARGLAFRRRSRIVPGPLRPAQTRARGGVAAGMLTGALLGLAFLAAFTLPFVRVGGGADAGSKSLRTVAAQDGRVPDAAGAAAERAADPDTPSR